MRPAITEDDTSIATLSGAITMEIRSANTIATAAMVTTMATDIVAKDRMGEAGAVVIRRGIAPDKATISPHVVTIGRMETGCIWTLHATIVQMDTKKIPPLQTYRIVCRLGAPDMEGAIEKIF